jgi:hypothetical protein
MHDAAIIDVVRRHAVSVDLDDLSETYQTGV